MEALNKRLLIIYNKSREKGYIRILISVFVIGYLVHGSRIYSFNFAHDDMSIDYPGQTFIVGRWFLQILYYLSRCLLGSHINAKGYIGISVFFLFTVLCSVIANALEIKNAISQVLLAACVVTFPYTVALFGYSYTAEYYVISLIMATISGCITYNTFSKKFTIKQVVMLCFSSIILALSMAVYQTSVCVYIAFINILLIKHLLERKNTSELKKSIAVSFFSLIFGGILYYFSNQLVLHILNLEMSSYQGLNNMSSFSIRQLFKGGYFAYKDFIYPSIGEGYYSIYVTSFMRMIYYGGVLSLIVMSVLVYKEYFGRSIDNRSDKLYKAVYVLFIVLLPLSINSFFLFADLRITIIKTFMIFSKCFIYVALIFFAEKLYGRSDCNKQKIISISQKTLPSVVSLILFLTSIENGYSANVAYTKVAIQQQQAIGYFNRLVTRIQSADGYSPKLKVAYLNGQKKNEEAYYLVDFDNKFMIASYDISSYLNEYNWIPFMHVWCGYDPTLIGGSELEELQQMPEVMQMPAYPADGSIKVVNDIVVVKFE